MGFWKYVAYDISRGMSKQTAVTLNAELRYGNCTESEKRVIEAMAEAEIKLNTLK